MNVERVHIRWHEFGSSGQQKLPYLWVPQPHVFSKFCQNQRIASQVVSVDNHVQTNAASGKVSFLREDEYAAADSIRHAARHYPRSEIGVPAESEQFGR